MAPAATTAATPIDARYAALGGASSFLGAPTAPEDAAGAGRYRTYAHGIIVWSASTGAWPVAFAVGAEYQSLGRWAGYLGFPLTGELPAANGGIFQNFQGGSVLWSAASGAHAVHGGIASAWAATGYERGYLGFPITDELPAAGGGVFQNFQGGTIMWSPATGAHPVHGAIATLWAASGYEGGYLGYPTSDEQLTGGGVVQHYQGGSVYWGPATGTFVVLGGIGQRYAAIGGGASGLGLPTGPESAAKGSGRYQNFEHGAMLWSPSTGAWEVLGAIYTQWAAQGYEYGFQGFPIGPEYDYLGGRRQDFQGNALLWDAAPVIDATYSPVSAGDVWATYRAGCPVGPSQLTLIRMNYWGFDNAVHRGELIIRSDLAGGVVTAFNTALANRYPIRQMWRVDYFGGDDPTSMAADNTSGFNCRITTGGTSISPHAYGVAIDVNTVENPYWNGHWWPNTDYVDRGNVRPGMLFAGSPLTVALANQGYFWAGYQTTYRDYQHFQHAY